MRPSFLQTFYWDSIVGCPAFLWPGGCAHSDSCQTEGNKLTFSLSSHERPWWPRRKAGSPRLMPLLDCPSHIPASIPISAPTSADCVPHFGSGRHWHRKHWPTRGRAQRGPRAGSAPSQDMLWWGLGLEKVLAIMEKILEGISGVTGGPIPTW